MVHGYVIGDARHWRLFNISLPRFEKCLCFRPRSRFLVMSILMADGVGHNEGNCHFPSDSGAGHESERGGNYDFKYIAVWFFSTGYLRSR